MDEFLVWADGREGKYELDGGHVVPMAPERVNHGRAKGRAFRAFADAIERGDLPYEALVDPIAVRIKARTTYVPDILIDCGEDLEGGERETGSAVVVVEVLSPSTASRDHGRKLQNYFRTSAVMHYLIVDADDRGVIYHARGTDGAILTRILSGGELTLDPPGLALNVEDVLPALSTRPLA